MSTEAFVSRAQAAQAATQRWDYLIIGAGTAGLPAAIFAAYRGAKVLLVDAANDIGGTLHLSAGQLSGAGSHTQVNKGIIDSPDQHFDDIMRLSNGKADAALARLVADHAGATINWLLEAGLTPLTEHPICSEAPGIGYSVARYLWDKDQGRAILRILRSALAPTIEQKQVTLLLNTRIRSLTIDGAGAVTGAQAQMGKSNLRFSAKRILLTSGGYAMNPKLFERLIERPAYAATSYSFSQGDGLNLAVAVGAALRGRDLHRAGTGSILSSSRFPAKVYARFNTDPKQRQPWEIWVNDEAKRFVCEDAPDNLEREQSLLREPSLRYYIIFDHAILDAAPLGIPSWTKSEFLEHFGKHGMFTVANSLASLAAKIGLDADNLNDTVKEYNAAVLNGHDRLGRQHLPLKIATPPYFAITHYGHAATSSAGVVVDNKLRVLKGDGTPIANLFAAGEVLGSGVNVGNGFVPGMMLTPALTFGRLLGQDNLTPSNNNWS
jgi:fumarate reductase flavoprotein subunit